MITSNLNGNLANTENIKILNKIFLSEQRTLREEFQNSAAEFKCAVEQVNFEDRTEAADQMNRWVKEATNGLVQNIIGEREINPRAVLFLFNTIYFKANWAEKFSPRKIRTETFYGVDGQEYRAQFMSSPAWRKFTHDNYLHADILQIDYADGVGYKFWIIQPTVETTISSVLEMLDGNGINEIANNLKLSHFKFTVPLFQIESKMNAKEALKNYGLESLFEDYTLDLAEGPLLKVDAAAQKTKIIVNTDGTEAATASYLSASSRMLRRDFIFNRAFIFLILTEATNEPIFVGHYVKP